MAVVRSPSFQADDLPSPGRMQAKERRQSGSAALTSRSPNGLGANRLREALGMRALSAALRSSGFEQIGVLSSVFVPAVGQDGGTHVHV